MLFEKVLDDSNIITVQTKEYGSIEVIPVDTITDIELADVQPIPRGHWDCVNEDYSVFMCANCGGEVMFDEGNPEKYGCKYCMFCGAKMDMPESIKG